MKLVGNMLVFSSEKGVYSVPKEGGTPTLLSDVSKVEEITADKDTLFLATEGTTSNSISNNDGAIYSLPLIGGDATLLVGRENKVIFPYGIAVDDQNVYFTDGGKQTSRGTGTIWSISKDPSSAFMETSIATPNQCLDRIEVLGDYVYWINSCATRWQPGISRIDKRGGNAIPIYDDEYSVSEFFIDNEFIYFGVDGFTGCTTCDNSPNDARVLKIALPVNSNAN